MAEGEWTGSIVMARFLEACSTEQFFTVDRPGVDKSYWPTFQKLRDDDPTKPDDHVWRHVYDEDARQRYLKDWQGKGSATSDAVSRYDEVQKWAVSILKDEKIRRIVWTWSFCAITPNRSFAKACRHFGWVRRTAYRRFTVAFEQIAAALNNERTLLRLPAEKWMSQLPASMACIDDTIGRGSEAAQPVVHPPYRAEPLSDLPETRDLSWAQRRWQREARLRAKLGIGEDAA
ncbi:hypothetical protein [Tardiphaga sp.]|uniref:hypothetical protein n=1 Tax=Tardiphaga sp. TaxID=1926292 RepID=UPI0026332145|nr:hypothetical protein [Tardiphaga sp.]MDB5620529.1 hypothetical protein [Tardiphaga sp.]